MLDVEVELVGGGSSRLRTSLPALLPAKGKNTSNVLDLAPSWLLASASEMAGIGLVEIPPRFALHWPDLDHVSALPEEHSQLP